MSTTHLPRKPSRLLARLGLLTLRDSLVLRPSLSLCPSLFLCIAVYWASVHSPSAHALDSRSCFSHAETYYETLYCEINAQAPEVALPNFWDFKKNNEVMQALLIKKPARKIYIEVARPAKSKQTVRMSPALTPSPMPTQSPTRAPTRSSTKPSRTACALQNQQMYCGGVVYQALGNTANSKLDAGVWSDAFKLALPRFNGDHQNSLQVQDYLKASYSRYLQRMLAIGLAGETFSFNKFAFFFADHHIKGVNFSERFEKMFYFLKKDKQNIAVNTAINLPSDMDTRYCETFANLLACAQERSNYLFERTLVKPAATAQ